MKLEGTARTWAIFFRPGTRVLALPGWTQPRVLIPADTVSGSWVGSSFYPAYRWSGRLFLHFLRLKAVAKLGAVVADASEGHAAFREFLSDVAPDAFPRAVQVGMPGRAQKLTVQLCDATGRVVAYVKSGQQALARERLLHEYQILQQLPAGIGPRPLKFGSVAGMDLLVLAPLEGEHLESTLPPPEQLRHFIALLTTSSSFALEAHPWAQQLRDLPEEVEVYLEALASRRSWPVVLQHGDLAPWNMLRTATGALAAVDWEYGRRDGFPGLDMAQYVLQLGLLVCRWSPDRTREYAIQQLAGADPLALSRDEAAALVSLAAYETYGHALSEGIPASNPKQAWRRAVWQFPGRLQLMHLEPA